jgi:anti-sigma B factor antagonist
MPSEQPLQIDVEQRDQLAVVRISGSATMERTEELKCSLFDVAQEPIQWIVLDLSELDFLCSEGLGAIVAAHAKCAHRGGSVRLAGPTQSIQELLDVTKLSKLFTVYLSVEDAVQA